jgi:hypothetical protein
MIIDILKSQLYLTELRLAQDATFKDRFGNTINRKRGDDGRLLPNTGSSSSDSTESKSDNKSETETTPAAVKAQAKSFVESIYPKKLIDLADSLKDTPEHRKAVKDAINQIGKDIDSKVKKAANEAVDAVKNFDYENLLAEIVEKTGDVITSPIVRDVSNVVAIAVGSMAWSMAASSVILGITGALATGAVWPAVASIGTAAVLVQATNGAMRLIQSNLNSKERNTSKQDRADKESTKKLRAMINDKKLIKDHEPYKSSEEVVKALGIKTAEPSPAFQEKYTNLYGQRYNPKKDEVVKMWSDGIASSVDTTKDIMNAMIQQKINPNSLKGRNLVKDLQRVQKVSENLIEQKQEYYKRMEKTMDNQEGDLKKSVEAVREYASKVQEAISKEMAEIINETRGIQKEIKDYQSSIGAE